MRFLPSVVLAFVAVASILEPHYVLAKKPSRPRATASASRRSGGSSRASGRQQPPVSRRRPVYEEEEEEFEEDEEEELGILPGEMEEEDDFYGDEEEEEEEDIRPRRKGSSARRLPPSSRTARGAAIHASSGRKRPPARKHYEDDFEDDYGPPRPKSGRRGPSQRGPPPRSSRGGRRPGGRPGSVVPYSREPQESAFTRGLAAVRSSLPDPAAVRQAAASSLSAARQTTSNLSSNLYREVKGLTSSELEQVMLKSTRPDDSPVKGKHVERLVGVTYQISARYDIYDAVLRKLWAKMSEKDWRTTIKALYILHRFSSDGAPEHAPALKARLRELRRTRDPKRKDKYFNSKQLLAGDSKPENIKFRAFMARYAHYVLLRAQCFGGMFDEISQDPKADKKKPPKPITATTLRAEHLEAAAMLLKAGVACQLKEGEECENTAIAAERVASDLIGLTSAVAIALNRALKSDDLKGGDPTMLKKWCVFYSEELLPQTKAMVKKTSSKLDAYGLFLPSRMGTSVSAEVLQKGLSLEGKAAEAKEDAAVAEEGASKKEESREDEEEEDESSAETRDTADEVVDDEAEFDEEYEYEEEEYYDDEEL